MPFASSSNRVVISWVLLAVMPAEASPSRFIPRLTVRSAEVIQDPRKFLPIPPQTPSPSPRRFVVYPHLENRTIAVQLGKPIVIPPPKELNGLKLDPGSFQITPLNVLEGHGLKFDTQTGVISGTMPLDLGTGIGAQYWITATFGGARSPTSTTTLARILPYEMPDTLATLANQRELYFGTWVPDFSFDPTFGRKEQSYFNILKNEFNAFTLPFFQSTLFSWQDRQQPFAPRYPTQSGGPGDSPYIGAVQPSLEKARELHKSVRGHTLTWTINLPGWLYKTEFYSAPRVAGGPEIRDVPCRMVYDANTGVLNNYYTKTYLTDTYSPATTIDPHCVPDVQDYLKPQLKEILKYQVRASILAAKDYKDVIKIWDVINEPTNGDGINLLTWSSLWSMTGAGSPWSDEKEYLVVALQAADAALKEIGSNAKLFINEFGYEVENGGGAQNSSTPAGVPRKAEKFYQLIQYLKSRSDVRLDGVGIQAHYYTNQVADSKDDPAPLPSRATLEKTIQKYVNLGVEVQISEMDVGMTFQDRGGPGCAVGTFDYCDYDDTEMAKQAKIFGDTLWACLRVKGCTGFTAWGFDDAMVKGVPGSDGLIRSGRNLFKLAKDPTSTTEAFEPKPAYFALRDALAGAMIPFGGAVFKPENGDQWALWGNGGVEKTVNFPDRGDQDFEVQLLTRGSPVAGVWPLVNLRVDGKVVRTFSVTNSDWATLSISNVVVSSGLHSVRVEFTNDAMSGGEDRNLFIRALIVK